MQSGIDVSPQSAVSLLGRILKGGMLPGWILPGCILPGLIVLGLILPGAFVPTDAIAGNGKGNGQSAIDRSETTATDYDDFLAAHFPHRPYSRLSPVTATVVGGGVYVMDGLANFGIGVMPNGETKKAGMAFVAEKGGNVKSLRVYWIGNETGYSLGNGGVIRIRIYPTFKSGEPYETGKPLAEGVFVPDLPAGASAGWIREVALKPLAPLVVGKHYMVVFQNIDKKPAENWISVNASSTFGDNYPPSAIFGKVGEWLMWESINGVWSPRGPHPHSTQIPILQVTTDTGRFGLSDYQTGNVVGKHFVFTKAAPIREHIRPNRTRTWYGGAIALNTTTGGHLDWVLAKADGTVMNMGSFFHPTANDAMTKVNPAITKFSEWFPFWFGTEGVELRKDTDYYLTFVPRGDAIWKASAEQNLGQGFEAIAPTEVAAQHMHSGKWLFSVVYDHTSSARVSSHRVIMATTGR